MDPRLAGLLVLLPLLGAACGREAPRTLPVPTPPPSVETPGVTPTEIRFAAVGDIGDGNDVQRKVGARIAALHAERPIDVLLLLGDIIYPDGNGARYGAKFGDPWRVVLDAGIPMAAVLGNHDVQTRSGRDVVERFGMPSRYYSFRRGPVTFFALDTNRFDTGQLEWLRAELQGADTPWRIPFMHAPAYSSGQHGSTNYVQRGLDPISREFDVPLVLAGHDHDYERTHPIGGTVYVVAGTGCCVRSVGRSDFTAVALSEPGVLLGEADGERLLLRFVGIDGGVLDEATLQTIDRVGAAPA